MRRLLRWLLVWPLTLVARSLLRAFVTGLIFFAGAYLLARYLGYPVPGISELRQLDFESVTRLGKLLS